ncbi:DNA-protecting protein DprA [Pantoea agglomerans]|uniref:DNA-protecting protein DprA n=1 Tax=Enterobacter agglomerans TaxID=549 RepID=UPI000E21149E|nr:DNA-protecting protein DprA [Pantoea agglomerans]MCH9407981.1 DNA-protecting protein DprA [Pantoea agglomerans]QTC50958.1 DNA-protecting protein DprA [Pantoea agglomerans]WNK31108.1 DNA-protecting protein DprA [Pantoea agglomerans]WNK62940.1 DNA-protecting protein DprA [Pantoea agglomerans]
MDKIAQSVRLAAVTGMTGKRWVDVAQQIGAGQADREQLIRLGLDESQCQQYYDFNEKNLTEVYSWLAQSPAHHLVTALDAAYPARLKETNRFPPLLYIDGDPALISTPQLAVVGSRNCSHYGRYWCDWFTQHLSLSGLTITSGLARGIDGVAHQAALNVGGKTVAVLGSGLQRLYPSNHAHLAAEIVEQGGAVVSEFPLTTLPHPPNFPRRNRIISGLSHGVLVVEASLKSGSLVTARYGLEQNRNVYALPGALGNPLSEGVNWLIQQGALLVAHPNNIVEDLASALNWLPETQADEIYSEVSDDAPLPFADVLANVGDDVTPVDVVAERAGQSVPVISAQLLELELAGWIAAVPGGYVRLRRACHVRRTDVFV